MGNWKKASRSKRVGEVSGKICPTPDDEDKSIFGEIYMDAVNRPFPFDTTIHIAKGNNSGWGENNRRQL